MAHLVFYQGQWSEYAQPWTVEQWWLNVAEPQVGDTFTDVTSGEGAIKDLDNRGFISAVTGIGPNGEKGYRIAKQVCNKCGEEAEVAKIGVCVDCLGTEFCQFCFAAEEVGDHACQDSDHSPECEVYSDLVALGADLTSLDEEGGDV